jgi:RNA polymerase sigma-70 factor (family 1)
MYQENLHTWEDSALLLEIVEKNRLAFDVLYDRHFKMVFNAAYKRLKDPDQASDITQEVFVQLWARKSRAPIVNFPAYLFTAVRNTVFKFMERERRYEPLPALFDYCDENSAAADTLILHREFLEAFEQLVLSMSPQQQIIFRMRYEEDMAPSEIAEELNLSPKTVRNQLGKALIRLKGSLAILLMLYFIAVHK